ncbi:unnamed protein product [Linum trigynum]|uniref:RNase H type-1 domain-containing protein n=1 Tax=Linum trigynum TaxID=586398 RepID=A0AAV2DRR2_9ROSI
MVYLVWHVWKSRNEIVFRGRNLWPPTTCSNALSDLALWSSCSRRQAVLPFPPQPTDYLPQPTPTPGNLTYEIHYDGSFINNSQEAAFGVVIINNHGQVTNGKMGSSNVLLLWKRKQKQWWKASLWPVSLDLTALSRQIA